jgi:hypothetical protein
LAGGQSAPRRASPSLPVPAEGFTSLVKDGKIKDTAEYLIVSFPNDFPSDVVQLAQSRIDRENKI